MKNNQRRLEPSLEEIEQKAEADKLKVIKPDQIPKRRLPPLLRLLIRLTILPFILLDLAVQKLAIKFWQPPFQPAGRCKMRGNCCQYILFPEKKGLVSKFFYLWNTEVNGFFPREQHLRQVENIKVRVMGCRYLTQEGKCSNYLFRPMLCRTYPFLGGYRKPKLLKGCGYFVREKF